MNSIDINCDVGEGIGNEKELFSVISSCNIACGGHAGDRDTMTHVVHLAKEYDIKIGAHPSYPDKENFGRKSLDISPKVLIDSIIEQLTAFSKILENEGVDFNHIKAHGALYNDLARDSNLAMIFIKAIGPFIDGLKLYAPYGSALASEAFKKDIPIVYEAFADRNYNDDLSLVSRSNPEALILEPRKVLNHVVRMVKEGKVRTIKDNMVQIKAETFCIHGDTPTALQILTYLAIELPKQHIVIAK